MFSVRGIVICVAYVNLEDPGEGYMCVSNYYISSDIVSRKVFD